MDRAFSRRLGGFSLCASLALLAACASSATTSAPSAAPSSAASAPASRSSSSNPSANLAEMLAGHFEGNSPGNQLSLNVQNLVLHSLEHPYDLFLEVIGKYQDLNVHQDGFLHLENQGQDVAVGYIPHFNPVVSALSPGAGRFTSSEANAACGVYFHPEGDGYGAETVGTTSCAFAIRGATGKWSVQVEPGSIVVRNEGSGETLRFRRAGK